jgi:hypothetical protein
MSESSLSDAIVDQGIYQNKGTSIEKNVPNLNLAFLSNTFEDKKIDEVITLNTIFLNWCDFTTLFFTPSAKAFYITQTNVLNKAISFYNQSYETTQNSHVVFNLADQIKKTWSKKTSKPESLISPQTNIQLSRRGFLTSTLGSLNVQGKVVGLSLDEAINALLSNNLIVPADSDSSAIVRFIVSYADTFSPLDITVMVNFVYETKIPCYKNVDECKLFCPYSKDTKPCREFFDCDKTYDKSDDKSDNASVIYEEKSVISGLTELINANKTVYRKGKI